MSLFRFKQEMKPIRFEYKPRYWDPKKEELEKRLARVKERNNDNPDAMKARISDGLRSRKRPDRRLRRSHAFRSNMMLLVILVALIIFTLVLLNIYLPKVMQYLQ